MSWREALKPVRMERVALLAPRPRFRDLLVAVADAGSVELDHVDDPAEGEVPAALALRRASKPEGDLVPRLASTEPDLDVLIDARRADLLAGEAELQRRARSAVLRADIAGLAGWSPAAELGALTDRLASLGAAVVPLPSAHCGEPPSLLRAGPVTGSVGPLVETYATVPYADVDPSLLAGLVYVVMFGMMFGDVGHAAMLLGGALLLRSGHPRRLARLRRGWPFLAGAGVAAAVFGAFYGEAFGPTGLVPVLWLSPVESPIPLLLAAVGLGAFLLAGAYLLGTLNRWREGGPAVALYSATGIAGSAVYLGAALAGGGVVWHIGALVVCGALAAAVGLTLAFTGLVVEAGAGAAGLTQATVELFDIVIRIGSSTVSFARLAAFGLTHGALAALVWEAARGLWRLGPLGMIGAVAVFVIGNAAAFGLEALVAGIQALRLEYYELFSRVFQGEGRPFRPWHIPCADASEFTASLREAP